MKMLSEEVEETIKDAMIAPTLISKIRHNSDRPIITPKNDLSNSCFLNFAG
jgi:hypothetical protein